MQHIGYPGGRLERDGLESPVHFGAERRRVVRFGHAPGGAEQIDQRQIWHGAAILLAAALPGGPDVHGEALVKCFEEARLADTKLTHNRHDLALPLLHTDQASVEQGQFRISADKRTAGRAPSGGPWSL